jgi:hypothetical protein
MLTFLLSTENLGFGLFMRNRAVFSVLLFHLEGGTNFYDETDYEKSVYNSNGGKKGFGDIF